MNNIDIFIGIGILLLTIIGYLRGFAREISSIIYFGLLVFALGPLSRMVSSYKHLFPENIPSFLISFLLAILIIFLISKFIYFILASIFKSHSKDKISLDKPLGAFVGLIKSLLILVLFLSIISLSGDNNMFVSSIILKNVKTFSNKFINYERIGKYMMNVTTQNIKIISNNSNNKNNKQKNIKNINELKKAIENNPKLKEILKDREIMEYIRKKDIPALMKNKRFMEVFSDPEVYNLFLNIDYKTIYKEIKDNKK